MTYVQRDASDYYGLFALLVQEFGFDPDYARGVYTVKCRLVNDRCTLCAGPAKVAECGHGVLVLHGIKPRIAQQLAILHSENEWRKFVCECFYRTGKWPNDEQVTKEEVTHKIEDPLKDFPHDVKFFTESQMLKLKEAAEMQSKHFKNPLPPHRMWTPERIKACRGEFGIVPRRCSVNDSLWGRYLDYKNRGIEMTLDLLRVIMKTDLLITKMQNAAESEQDDLIEELKTYV